MANGTATITVDADIARDWKAASVVKRKQLQARLRTWLKSPEPAQRQAPHLSRKESALLLKINQGLEPQQRQRLEELTDKMEFASISKEEHAELLRLADITEALTVARLKAVIELAKYRKLPLDEMMRQLGMEPGKYAR